MVSVGIVAATAPALAQCVFDMPNGSSSYIGSISTSLVRAFVSCNNPGGNAANSETETGVASCQPVETFDQKYGPPNGGWRFGPGTSYGRFTITRTSASYPDFPLAVRDAVVKLKLYHIDSTDGGPATGIGRFILMLRVTSDDPVSGDMTRYDFPFAFDVPLSGNGSVSMAKKLGELLEPLGQPPFPDCTSIEVITAFIRDPNGNLFAVPGMKLK
jgi:hypothetical protein